MKLLSKILVLFTSSFALSSTIQENTKQSISINYDENADCIQTLLNYEECLFKKYNNDTLKKENYDDICEIYNSDKCQKFYKEGVVSIPECKELGEVLTFQNQILYDKADYTYQRICSKDENGKYCPLSGYDISENKDSDREAHDEAVNETCKSRKCIDSAIESINKEINLNNGINEFQSKIKNNINKRQYDSSNIKDEDEKELLINFFESDFCSSQAPKNISSEVKSRDGFSTSDAFSIKYSSALLVIFVLYFGIIF